MSSDITRINTAAESRLVEQFEAAHGSIPGVTSERRAQAIEAFARTGLPHRRIEAWHYTDLRTVMREAFPPASAPSVESVERARAFVERLPAARARAVLIDGHFTPELSRSEADGVAIRSMLDVLGEGASDVVALLAARTFEEQEAVLALNAAFMQGGAVVHIAPGAQVEQPIEIVFITTAEVASATATRSLLHVGEGSAATVVERHESIGKAPAQGNHVVIVAVDASAKLDHIVMTSEGGAGVQQVATMIGNLQAQSEYTSFALVRGSGLVRRQAFLEFQGSHAKGTLRGVGLLDGAGHADTTLLVTHKATHCESRELFKHILDGTSTGVFQGKVVVAPGAQKTDGKMMSRAIFLADGANMYNKPELEIFADDVVCGHGATAGFLNEEQLFYLRARGVPKKEAEALLLEAFAAEAIEDVGTEAIRAELTESVGQWLRQRQD